MEHIKIHLQKVLTRDRYKHSLLVTDTAIDLARIYKINKEQAEIAALLHDCAKYMNERELREILKHDDEIKESDYLQPEILHGFAGAIVARNIFGIEDKEILNAIKYHTVGRVNMSMLEKIIYIADWIEPSRKSDHIDEVRKVAKYDLDAAIIMTSNNQIEFLMKKGKIIHINTVQMRNSLIAKKIK